MMGSIPLCGYFMTVGFHKRMAVAVCAVLCLLAGGGTTSHALLLDLDAYVQYSIVGPDGVTPLAPGSIVYIIGSGDSLNDGIDTFPPGSGTTNYMSGSTLGDDVVLATVTLDGSGTFLTTIKYESDDIHYVYIRYFDATNNPVEGYVAWGTSVVYHLGQTLGVSTVVFDPTTNLVASNHNNFVAIPEPSTAGLYLLAAGMFMALRSTMRKKTTGDVAHRGGDAS